MKSGAASAPIPAARPARDPWFHPFAPYVIPFALALAARIDAWRTMPFAAEDAYIVFRYAENAARGLGLVYNPGERVMGFTSPLWAAWLTVGASIGATVFWARLWGVLFSLAALVVMTRAMDREPAVGRASAWAFAVFFAVFPLFSAHAVLGLEVSLFVLLVAAAVAARASSRPPVSGVGLGVVLGLLALTRPEGFAIAVALAVFAGARARIVAGVLALVGIGALAAYYGNPVPQSFLAKAGTYGVGLKPAAMDWIEGFIPAFFGYRWHRLAEGLHLFPLAVVALPALLVTLWTLARRRAWSPTLAFALSGLGVLAAYVLAGVPYFGWYYVLPIAAWAAAVAAGLPLVIRSRLVWAALAVYVLTDAAFLSNLYVLRSAGEVKVFGAAADRLKAASDGRGTVFLEPIGIIGYHTKLPVIDEVGLVSPDIPRRRRTGDGWYGDVIRERRPEWLVVRPALMDRNESIAGLAKPFRSFAERDQVLAAYTLVGEPPTAPDQLVVLARRVVAGAP